jgi:hypothetical protein
MKNFVIALLVMLSLPALSQKAITIKISCPLTDAKEVFEKQPYSLGKDLKVILSSATDTTVKAGIAVTVTNIQRDEDKTWIIVCEYKTYYFWYSGITKPLVREDQKIKAGDALGIIAPNGKLELHVFDFETPVDPKKVLDCKLDQ